MPVSSVMRPPSCADSPRTAASAGEAASAAAASGTVTCSFAGCWGLSAAARPMLSAPIAAADTIAQLMRLTRSARHSFAATMRGQQRNSANHLRAAGHRQRNGRRGPSLEEQPSPGAARSPGGRRLRWWRPRRTVRRRHRHGPTVSTMRAAETTRMPKATPAPRSMVNRCRQCGRSPAASTARTSARDAFSSKSAGSKTSVPKFCAARWIDFATVPNIQSVNDTESTSDRGRFRGQSSLYIGRAASQSATRRTNDGAQERVRTRSSMPVVAMSPGLAGEVHRATVIPAALARKPCLELVLPAPPNESPVSPVLPHSRSICCCCDGRSAELPVGSPAPRWRGPIRWQWNGFASWNFRQRCSPCRGGSNRNVNAEGPNYAAANTILIAAARHVSNRQRGSPPRNAASHSEAAARTIVT